MLAGEVRVGARFRFSGCRCVFTADGRDPVYPSHVLFKLAHHCRQEEPRTAWRCDMKPGQVLWLFDDRPIAGVPGSYDLVPEREARRLDRIRELMEG